MAKSSINIKPSSSNAIIHNERVFDVAYAIDSESRNEYKTIGNIKDVESEIYADYLEHHGRRLNSKATPIREAVINLNENHIMADVEKLCNTLQREFKIQPLHISIHRDEGHIKDGEKVYNYHAHVVFSNYDFETHRSIKLDKFDMSRMQTITADTLNMERGVEGSQSQRLEHREYKRAMQESEKAVNLKLTELAEELQPLLDLNEKHFKAQNIQEFTKQIEKKLEEFDILYKQTREQMKETKQAKQLDYSALKTEFEQVKKELLGGIDKRVNEVFNNGFQAYQNLLKRNNKSVTQKIALKALDLPQHKLLHLSQTPDTIITNIEKALILKQQIEETPVLKEVIKEVEKIVEIEKVVEVIVEKKIENKVIHDINVNNVQALEIKDLKSKNHELTLQNLQLRSDKNALSIENQNLETENSTLKIAVERFLGLDVVKGVSDTTKSIVERLNVICDNFKNYFTNQKTEKQIEKLPSELTPIGKILQEYEPIAPDLVAQIREKGFLQVGQVTKLHVNHHFDEWNTTPQGLAQALEKITGHKSQELANLPKEKNKSFGMSM